MYVDADATILGHPSGSSSRVAMFATSMFNDEIHKQISDTFDAIDLGRSSKDRFILFSKRLVESKMPHLSYLTESWVVQ